MTKCTCLRISDEAKDTLNRIKDHFDLKSNSAVINELFYFIRHGSNYPGSQIDMSEFFNSVLRGDFIFGKGTLQERMLARQQELTQEYIKVLSEEYGDSLLALIAADGVRKALDPKRGRWMLNIQHTIMERCNVGLLDSEVTEICARWYDSAKMDGTISQIQMSLISKNWDKSCKQAEIEESETISHFVGEAV